MFKKLTNIGDNGIVCDFGEEVNPKINANVIQLFQFIKSKANNKEIEGIINYTPSYNKLIVNFDLNITTSKKIYNFLESINFKNLNLSVKKKRMDNSYLL